MVLKFESANEVYDMEYINRTIDYCKFFSNKRYEPVLQVFFGIFAAKSDMARSCPIKKVIRDGLFRKIVFHLFSN